MTSVHVDPRYACTQKEVNVVVIQTDVWASKTPISARPAGNKLGVGAQNIDLPCLAVPICRPELQYIVDEDAERNA